MSDNSEAHRQDDHDAILALLPDYLTLAAEGGEPERIYPQVAEHLRRCKACQTAAEELSELGALAYSGAHRREESQPLAAPAPQSSRPEPLTLVRTTLGDLVLTFTRGLVEAWLQPTLAGAFRGQLLARDVVASAEPLSAELQLELRAVEDGSYQLDLRLQLPERDPLDQGGVTVRLLGGARRYEEQTDELGGTVFEGLSRAELSKLQIVITTHRPSG